MRLSNQTGQVLLSIGVAGLAALFYALRDVVRHWRVWHLSAVVVFGVVVVLLWRYSLRNKRSD